MNDKRYCGSSTCCDEELECFEVTGGVSGGVRKACLAVPELVAATLCDLTNGRPNKPLRSLRSSVGRPWVLGPRIGADRSCGR